MQKKIIVYIPLFFIFSFVSVEKVFLSSRLFFFLFILAFGIVLTFGVIFFFFFFSFFSFSFFWFFQLLWLTLEVLNWTIPHYHFLKLAPPQLFLFPNLLLKFLYSASFLKTLGQFHFDTVLFFKSYWQDDYRAIFPF